MTIKVVGGILLAAGAVVAIIVGAWGRSGFYVSQAPALVVLGLLALGLLGAGLGLLRYGGSRLSAAPPTRGSLLDRSMAAPPIARSTPTVSSVDESTRDRPTRSGWLIVLPSGSIVPVLDGLTVGRRPISPDGGPTAVLASDEVSATHARFTLQGEKLLVSDLGSTNGTVIVSSDGSEREVGATPVAVEPDDHVELGTFVVTVSGPS